MNTKRICALICAIWMLTLTGCGGQTAAPSSAPKPGVVYLDPNAPKESAATAAPAALQTAVPAAEAPDAEPNAPEGQTPETPLDLYFECRGVRLEPWMEAVPALAALGEPIAALEADSCAYLGKDVFYVYPGVQLTVNQVEGVERITSILVTDDTVTIPQGLRIYDEEEKLLDQLGGTEDNGVYTYQSGQTLLLVQVKETEDGIRRIASMEYRAAEEQ